MRELNTTEVKKLQKYETEILKEFDRIARKNKLRYMLVGGTLIGSIRHKGFIPWDDDIDIGMPRKDYEKFKKIVNKQINKNKFYFQDLNNTENYGMIFGKLMMKDTLLIEKSNNIDKDKQGFWIDIFPFDKTSKNMFIAKYNLFKVYKYKLIYYLKCGNTLIEKTFVRKTFAATLKFLCLFYSKKKCLKKINKISHKYDYLDDYSIVSYGGTYIFKEIHRIDYFRNLIEGDFENNKFYIPKEYDIYLTNVYGDYMKLPPKEKQKTHHEIEEIKFPNEK